MRLRGEVFVQDGRSIMIDGIRPIRNDGVPSL
jgi:hypothetical protein